MSITFLTPIIALIILSYALVYSIMGYKAGLVKSALNLAVCVASAFLGAAFSVLIVAMCKKLVIKIVSDLD